MNLAARLSEFLAAWSTRAVAFDWRSRNCVHFAAAWVLEQTGRDVLAGVARTPHVRAARRVLASMGGGLAEAWTRQHAGLAVSPLLAQTGDLALVPLDSRVGAGVGAAIGICSGRDVVLLAEDGQLAFRSIDQATIAWRLA